MARANDGARLALGDGGAVTAAAMPEAAPRERLSRFLAEPGPSASSAPEGGAAKPRRT